LRSLRLRLRTAIDARAVIPVRSIHQEIHMANPAETTKPVSLTGTPFSEKSTSEKFTWLGKCLVMLLTGGFAFPNIFVE
jgi:hypothetical protein